MTEDKLEMEVYRMVERGDRYRLRVEGLTHDEAESLMSSVANMMDKRGHTVMTPTEFGNIIGALDSAREPS